jgi:carbohydrate-selective porin OprB
LLGDWGGARTRLEEEKGVKFDFHYVSDFLYNTEGGRQQRANYWERVRGTMDIDFGKLANLQGLSFHITGLWQGGVSSAGTLGSLAGPSSITSIHTTRLDSFWFQQDMFNKKLSVRVGQFAGQDFYGVQNLGGNYILEPLGYAFGNLFNDYEQYDPVSGPAAEIKIAPIRQFYYRAMVSSGNRHPGIDDDNGFHFVKHDSGVFLNEVGFMVDQPGGTTTKEKYYPGLYKVGSSYNGGKFTDPFSGKVNGGNYLVYFMATQAVFRPEAGSNKGLDVNFGADFSPNEAYNMVDKQFTGGLSYTGLIPQRSKDIVSFGFVYSNVSDIFSSEFANSGLLNPRLGSEKAFDINYLTQVTPWLILQPVVEVFSDLGGVSNQTGVVAGFRTKVTF